MPLFFSSSPSSPLLPSSMTLTTLVIVTTLIIIITSGNNNNHASIVSAQKTLAFHPADFTYKAPAAIETINGVDVIGVNASLGCGYSDPKGDYAEDAAFFEVNFTTPEEYMYRLAVSSYAPNALANSYWLFLVENILRDQSPIKQEVGTPHNTKNEIRTRNEFCLHFGASSTIPNTIRFKPREPGAMMANFTLTMINPPKITEVLSVCSTGDCDLEKPVPMRVFLDGEICGAQDTHAKFGDIIFTSKKTGAEFDCSFREQRTDPDGRWFVDCLIPTNVTGGTDNGDDDISARIFWTASSSGLMPPLDAPTKASITKKKLSLAWIAAPVVAILIIGYLCYLYYKKWKATKDAPRDANNLATMFVAARGVAPLLEKFPKTGEEAIRAYDRIVRDACKTNNTFLARKIGESYLVVAKQPADLFKASAEIQKTLEDTKWYEMLTGNDAPPQIVVGNKTQPVINAQLKTSANKYRTSNNSAILRNSKMNLNSDILSGDDTEGSIELYSQSNNNSALLVQSYESSTSNNDTNKNSNDDKPEDGGEDALNPFMENTGRVPLANRMIQQNSNNTNNNKNHRLSKDRHSTSNMSLPTVSPSEGSSRFSSSSRPLKTVDIAKSGITCSIAIVVGKGRITVHEAGTVSDYESFEYAGDVVDEAASIVDLAHPCQVLTVSTVHDSVKQDIASLGSFTILEEKTHSGKHLKFIQFNPSGCEVITDGLQEEENFDSIQAQLDAASLGFASKVCTLLYLEIHGLTTNATREDDKKAFLKKYKCLYNPITEIVKHLGGTVINITSTNLVISFNAFSSNPMHVTRAATCIYRLRDLFNSTTILKNFSLAKVSFCGGLATGNAVCGSVEADKSHKQIFGAAWDSAQSLMQMARARLVDGSMNCPVFAVWNSRSDLNQQTIQFVDIVQLPTSDKNQSINQATPITVVDGATAANHQNLRGLIAVMREQSSKSTAGDDDNEEDNEWMYELQNAEANNPYFHTNEAYTCLLSNFVGDAEEKWNTVLKAKLEEDEDDEVKTLEMVGLKQLAVIMNQGWDEYIKDLPMLERL